MFIYLKTTIKIIRSIVKVLIMSIQNFRIIIIIIINNTVVLNFSQINDFATYAGMV